MKSPCSINGCARMSHARGVCAPHYATWHRKQEKYPATCIVCGKRFNAQRAAQAKCCSQSCAATVGGRARAATTTKTKLKVCPQCEVNFGWGSRGKKYCSSECLFSARSTAMKAANRRNPRKKRPKKSVDYDSVIAKARNGSHVDNAGCWIWDGPLGNDGYPRSKRLYRNVVEAKHRQPLGKQAVVHHKCAVRACVNPDHLQPVTHIENTAEMLARQTYLKRIRDLESALAVAVPDHPLLAVVAVA